MIINRILDHNLDLQDFKRPDKYIFTTHVQRDEILNTPDATRCDELLSIFQELDNSIPTESALWGKSNWGESKWAKDNLVERILEELNKKDKRKSNPQDALIADTAIKNNCILVTEDGPLYDVVKEVFKGSVQKLEEFLKSS
jgi:hypothetical protein